MIPGTQAYPLGQIDLSIIFGDRANFCSEVLTFEVVDFPGLPCHLGAAMVKDARTEWHHHCR